MVSSQATAFWAAMRAGPQQISLPLAARRQAGELAEEATSEPQGVGYIAAPTVGGFWAVPLGVTATTDILYLFGGGYVLGSPSSRRKTAGHLALAANARVLVASYRLAPEHPFPAALEDALAAFEFMRSDQPQAPCAIVGDSAGGGLAVACGLALRDRGRPIPTGIAAMSPWADLTCSGDTMTEHAGRDIECTRSGLLEMARSYLGDHDPRDPDASPVFGHFDGMPPLYLVVGADEVLLDDSVRLARAAGLGGCSVELRIAAGMQHVFPIWCGAFPEADAEMNRLGRWFRSDLPGGAAHMPT